MTTLKAVEAKSHFSEILERASKGEEFVVTRRGEPVARLVPFSNYPKKEIKLLLTELKEFRKNTKPARESGENWNDLAREGMKW